MQLPSMTNTKFTYKIKLVNELEFTKSISHKTISIFTDGSCTSNGNRTAIGGYAIVYVSGYLQNSIIYGKVNTSLTHATNIRAEGTAILVALQKLLSKVTSKKWNKCIIYTDSEFWLKMLYDYMPKWPAAHFKLKANPDITIAMWDLWTQLSATNKTLEIVHVYAHNKDNRANSTDPYKKFTYECNALADELAGIARELTDYELVQEKL